MLSTLTRIIKFEALLKRYYSPRLVNLLLHFDFEKENVKFIKDKVAINKFLIEFKRNINEGCKRPECIQVFGKGFQERPMEIPGGNVTLNFKGGERAALIMVVGEAAGPGISTHLNLAYGLVNLHIRNDGRWAEKENNQIFEQLEKEVSNEGLGNLRYKKYKYWEKSSKAKKLEKYRNGIENHKLWEYFAEIFGIRFEFIKNNLYITDLCKCNAKGNQKWKECSESCIQFLYEEVQLITPLLIIFLGRESQEQFTNYLLKKKGMKITAGLLNDVQVNMSKYYEDFKSLRLFKSFEMNRQQVFMINIYHNKWLTDFLNEEKKALVKKYVRQCRTFMKEEILPLLKTEL